MKSDRYTIVCLTIVSICIVLALAGCGHSTGTCASVPSLPPLLSGTVAYAIVCDDRSALPPVLTVNGTAENVLFPVREWFRVSDRRQIRELMAALTNVAGKHDGGVTFSGTLGAVVFVSTDNRVLGVTWVIPYRNVVLAGDGGCFHAGRVYFKDSTFQYSTASHAYSHLVYRLMGQCAPDYLDELKKQYQKGGQSLEAMMGE